MQEQQPIASSGAVSRKAEMAGEKIERTAQRIEDEAIDQIHGLRARWESSVNDKRSQTVNRMHTVGAALRSASSEIEGDDRTAHDILEYTSDRVDRAAQYFSDVTLDELGQDLARFARRRPGLTFGGALLLGVAAGRALRAFARAAAEEGESEGRLATWEPSTRALGGGAP